MSYNDGLISRKIDQFKVLEHIGRGGMADVYLAEDTKLDRRVVLKLMLSEITANEELSARFRREAQITAQLAHPNIVQIYQIGLTPTGQPYLALQYIGGGSLSHFLQELAGRQKWISTAYTLAIAGQMTSALSAAHAAGIVHRDLKPSNILLQDDGTAVLADLGIASIQQASTRLTRTGGVLGTPHYMSPEQALGHPVDGRSDIYSLGTILYELLSKRPPFDADSPIAIVHQQVYQQPIPLEQIRHGLAPETYQLVRNCLQKDPAARFQTARELALAIERAARFEGSIGSSALTEIDTPPLGTAILRDNGPRLSEKKQTRWIKLTLALLTPIFLLAIAYAAVNLFSTGPVSESPTIVPIVTKEVVTESPLIVQVTDPIEPPSKTPPPTMTLTASPQAALTQTPAPEPDTDGKLPGSGLVRMTSAGSSEYTPILSPDLSTLLFASDLGGTWQIYRMAAQGGEWQQLTDNSSDNYHPHFSPDGERVVFTSQMDENRDIYTMTNAGNELQRLTNTAFVDQYPSYSPDGQWIVYLSKRDRGWGVYTMRADGSEDHAVIDTEANETYPVFSADGQSIAFQSDQTGNHEIFTIPWTGGLPKQVTTNSARDANPVYSPDGKWIAFESDRSGNYEIYAVRPDGGGLRNLTNHAARDQLPAFSADGQWLLFQSDRDGSVDIFRQPFPS